MAEKKEKAKAFNAAVATKVKGQPVKAATAAAGGAKAGGGGGSSSQQTRTKSPTNRGSR